MASDNAESANSPTRIDRLSALPNEVLDNIFELAYEDQLIIAPLSKRLLPIHERSLCRKIYLKDLVQTAALVACLKAKPSKGKLVSELHPPLDERKEDIPKLFGLLARILLLCPLLQVLDLDVLPNFGDDSEMLKNTLGHDHVIKFLNSLRHLPLKHLIVSMQEEEDRAITDRALASVQEQPSLDELTISSWDDPEVEHVGISEPFALTGIKTLRVEGAAVDEESITKILEICPSLLHLHLVNTFAGSVDFNGVLPSFPTSLTLLHLEAKHPNVTVCDQFLVQFTSLRSIHLGAGFFSPSIHLVLLRLPLLQEIQLGNGILDFDGLHSLITGPSRLQHLRQIGLLDMFPPKAGLRVSSHEERRIRIDGPSAAQGWTTVERSIPWSEAKQDLLDLVEVGKKKGVLVSASISKYEEYREALLLEHVNRSILAAYHDSNPEDIPRARHSAKGRSWLPPEVDLYNFDSSRVELVQTLVPELNWFVLSLENKDDWYA